MAKTPKQTIGEFQYIQKAANHVDPSHLLLMEVLLHAASPQINHVANAETPAEPNKSAKNCHDDSKEQLFSWLEVSMCLFSLSVHIYVYIYMVTYIDTYVYIYIYTPYSMLPAKTHRSKQGEKAVYPIKDQHRTVNTSHKNSDKL